MQDLPRYCAGSATEGGICKVRYDYFVAQKLLYEPVMKKDLKAQRKLSFTRETIKKLNEPLTEEQLRGAVGGAVRTGIQFDTSAVNQPC